jgi:hypothetical protein
VQNLLRGIWEACTNVTLLAKGSTCTVLELISGVCGEESGHSCQSHGTDLNLCAEKLGQDNLVIVKITTSRVSAVVFLSEE